MIMKRVLFLIAVFVMLFQISVITSADENTNENTGSIDVSLQHILPNQDKETVVFYTDSQMNGYLTISPNNLTIDKDNVKVIFSVPKEMLESSYNNPVNIPEFNSTYPHTISGLKVDGANYIIEISFEKYDKSQALSIPFSLKFQRGNVPIDYKLPVKATISYDDISNDSNIINYMAKYDERTVTKHVEIQSRDNIEFFGGEAVQAPDGTWYIDPDNAESIKFSFSTPITFGKLRTFKKAVLVDTIPTYIDKDGNTVRAVFDAEKSPEWKLSDDGTKVTRIMDNSYYGYEYIHSIDGLLYFKFPNMKLEQDSKVPSRLFANLKNEVEVELTPFNKSAAENNDILKDDIKFIIADKPNPLGVFRKVTLNREAGIKDDLIFKKKGARFQLEFRNTTNRNLNNFILSDHDLDNRLKFTNLNTGFTINNVGNNETYQYLYDNSKVHAYKMDGTFDVYDTQNIVTFDETETYVGFELLFNEGANFPRAGTIYVYPQVEFKEPNKITYNEEDPDENIFNNEANVKYDFMGTPQKIVDSDYIKLVPLEEKLTLSKSIYDGNIIKFTGDKVGFYFDINATLNSEKDYNLKLVDLLPNNIKYTNTNIIDYPEGIVTKVEVIENYHNSGRTAIIYHLDEQLLIEEGNAFIMQWDAFELTGDLPSGIHTNEAYLVGDNLPAPQENNQTTDVYDLNNNGETDDKIINANANFTTLMPKGVFANKYIQKGENEPTINKLTLDYDEEFNYILSVTNDSDEGLSGTIIYDTLPNIGDVNPLNKNSRDSKYKVSLSDKITVEDGYKVYYTEDESVYNKTMSEALNSVNWKTDDEVDLSKVTAFKIVDVDNIGITKGESFKVNIPVKSPAKLNDKSLAGVKYEKNENGGMLGVLEATNSFAYTNTEFPNPRMSNDVVSEILMGGFAIKKVDQDNPNTALKDAKFELISKEDESFKQEVITDKNGEAVFSNLVSGEYILKETQAPKGYEKLVDEIDISIKVDNVNRSIIISIDDEEKDANLNNPYLIENKKVDEPEKPENPDPKKPDTNDLEDTDDSEDTDDENEALPKTGSNQTAIIVSLFFALTTLLTSGLVSLKNKF